MANINELLIQEFDLKPIQVTNIVKLIDAGNTIPFIARYRKEMTGGLDDQTLRTLYERLNYLRSLESRKQEVLRLIEEQGKLTDKITASLSKVTTLQEVEDIYRPFRPKRRTRASIAKEKGLEPLATLILLQKEDGKTIDDYVAPFIDPDKGINNSEEALAGAMDIIAEIISDNAEFRKYIRELFLKEATIVTSAKKEEDSVYRMYYDYMEPVAKIAGHRVLAINRGEKEEFLQVKLEVPEEKVIAYLKSKMIAKDKTKTSQYIEAALEDAYKRLLFPSIEREIRNVLTEKAEEKAIDVFKVNLKNLLMQPPVKGKVVLGLDPAYRTGCKLAVVDTMGKVLDTAVIYPTPPQNKVEEAKRVLKELITKYNVEIISIGNGTASRESEIFVSETIKELDRKIYYMVVSEAGASVYSASKLGADEFPEFDVSLRSAVSIARRLQDPLAELVKIDPRSIGVGQYQHDMNQKKLSESLRAVVEDAVNSVGVDINTASPSLLAYVSGINSAIAKNIVQYREAHGGFRSREDIKKVSKLGPKTFEQCAGFLRIPEGDNVLDNSSVHPESYDAAIKLLNITGHSLMDVKNRRLSSLREKVEELGLKNAAEKLGVGIPTLVDIINELLKPGRDPRDELPKPLLLSDVLSIEDLNPGMVLMGTVRNVASFGAFVDIGVHQDGLVHISQLSDSYIKDPMDVVSVGDIVKVKILDIDVDRKRISLSMKGL